MQMSSGSNFRFLRSGSTGRSITLDLLDLSRFSVREIFSNKIMQDVGCTIGRHIFTKYTEAHDDSKGIWSNPLTRIAAYGVDTCLPSNISWITGVIGSKISWRVPRTWASEIFTHSLLPWYLISYIGIENSILHHTQTYNQRPPAKVVVYEKPLNHAPIRRRLCW